MPQSTSALASFKADLDKTVSQAQADIEYLRTAKVEVVRKDPEQYAAQQAADRERKVKPAGADVEQADASSAAESAPAQGGHTEPTGVATILDRLSASSSQLQQTLNATLASASNNPNIVSVQQLRTQLAENLRISSAKENLDMSVRQAEKLAEEYLKKGDNWRKEAGKWFADAVKVVPPSDADQGSLSVPSWDGGDWYSFSTSTTARGESLASDPVLFDAHPQAPRQSLTALNVAGSRKEALLARLREDQQLLLIDPAAESESAERREEYSRWCESNQAHLDSLKIAEEGAVGGILPELLTDEQFWLRYLFHKHSIEEEDRRRRLILEESQRQNNDDFSWDDEPESSDPQPGKASLSKQLSAEADVTKTPTQPVVSSSTSPRDSEESYDLVSEQSTQRSKKVARPVSNPDDEDSDWE